MSKWGVYRSLEETLKALKAEEGSGIPEIQEVLRLFSEVTANEKVKSKENLSSSNSFIVLEGLDASGKSTVSRLLSNRFDGIVMSTPGAQFLSLRSFFDKQPTPLRRAYYSLGNYAASLEIANALMKSMVVLDRFWHSTAAYALAAQAESVAELPKVGDSIYMWPTDLQPYPDAVFFLKVSEAERIKRHAQRNTTDTSEEIRLAKDEKFRGVLQEAYKRMFNPVLIEIDADQPAAQVVENIYQATINNIKKCDK